MAGARRRAAAGVQSRARHSFLASCRRYCERSASSLAASSSSAASPSSSDAANANVAPPACLPFFFLSPPPGAGGDHEEARRSSRNSSRMLADRPSLASAKAISSRRALRRSAIAVSAALGDAAAAAEGGARSSRSIGASSSKQPSASSSPVSSSGASEANECSGTPPSPSRMPLIVSRACPRTLGSCSWPSRAAHSAHSARTVGVLARSRAAVSEPRYDCSHAAFGLRKKSSAQPLASSGAPRSHSFSYTSMTFSRR
mmetsp:Transcript_36822/g.109535  ORF Transcript_36822/g.109535 Transcript_36822/m.109535 type:complete len:258 (+) Transcript_36822:304-1077(+)